MRSEEFYFNFYYRLRSLNSFTCMGPIERYIPHLLPSPSPAGPLPPLSPPVMQRCNLAAVPRERGVTSLANLLTASPPPNLPSSTRWAGSFAAAISICSHGRVSRCGCGYARARVLWGHPRRHDAGVKADAGSMDLGRQ
jgi:hypothetical protein